MMKHDRKTTMSVANNCKNKSKNLIFDLIKYNMAISLFFSYFLFILYIRLLIFPLFIIELLLFINLVFNDPLLFNSNMRLLLTFFDNGLYLLWSLLIKNIRLILMIIH